MATRVLNILPRYFDDVATGVKPFELRRNTTLELDDVIIFREASNGVPTGRVAQATVSYVRPTDGPVQLPADITVVGLRDARRLS